MQDQFGNSVTCASAEALAAYDRAVDLQLHAWPGVFEALDEAIVAVPDFSLAHALHALVLAAWGRGPEARAAIARAQAAPHPLPREASQIDLIATVIQGRTQEALGKVYEHIRAWPTDALAASTAMGAYGLLAFSGRADHNQARLAFVDGLASHFPENFPWLLANRGWARIELRQTDEGLAMARQALALRPANGHNAHIMMHGLYETNQPQAALDFIGAWLPGYPDHGLIWGHLQWHGALSEIALGQHDKALQRLQGPITDYLPRGAPFMGLADIISLPWRLDLLGVAGVPWAVAQQHVAKYFPNGANPFGELHLAMLAAARRDRAALEASVQRMTASAEAGHEGARVVAGWGQALQAALDGDDAAARSRFDTCCVEAVRVGGSHAQRDVIELTRAAGRIPSVAGTAEAAWAAQAV